MKPFAFIILLTLCIQAQAQNMTDKSNDILDISEEYEQLTTATSIRGDSLNKETSDKISTTYLPPLSLFLESVKEHPTVKIFNEKRIIAISEYKTTRMSWLNYLRITGSYQYGKYYAVTGSADEMDPQYVYANDNKRQSQYNIGVNLSIPLGDLFGGYKQNLKSNKAKMREVEYEMATIIENRKLIVLDAYNQVMKELAVFKAKAEAAALYNAQMAISENSYIRGQIDIISLSLEKGRRSNAIVDYESGKVSLQNAITLLEMLTNVKVLNK
ncbi:MAG: TolC family protein [Bacteroidaceae bacterium]